MSQYSLKQAINLVAQRTGAELSDAKATIKELYPSQTRFTDAELADVESIYQEAVSVIDQQAGGPYLQREDVINNLVKHTGQSHNVIDYLIEQRYGSVVNLSPEDYDNLLQTLKGSPQH